MALIGKVRQVGNAWYVEHQYPLYNEPLMVGVRWLVESAKRTGNTAFAPEMVDGLEMRYDDISRTWSAFKDGGYLVLFAREQGEQLEPQPITCPRVRQTTETRYRNGAWQKYSKREGWITA